MGHVTSRLAYQNLVERLNRFPQGAPPSDLLYRILEMLFSEDEARRVALLLFKPFKSEAAAKVWKSSPAETRSVLDRLADRGILIDVDQNGDSVYSLPPPMAGFLSFPYEIPVHGTADRPLLELNHSAWNSITERHG